MGTATWGPDTWYVIHVIADSSPDTFTDNDKKAYRDFIVSLSKVLPCPTCSIHFREFLNEDPPFWNTRIEFIQWAIRAHNNANKHTGAPVLSEEEALHRIQVEMFTREILRTGAIRWILNNWNLLITGLGVAGIVYIIYKFIR